MILTHLHGDHVGGLGGVMANADTAMGYAGEADVAGITHLGSCHRSMTGTRSSDSTSSARPVILPDTLPCLDADAGCWSLAMRSTPRRAITGPNPAFSRDIDAANESVRHIAEFAFDTAVFGHGDPVVGMADQLVADLVAEL